MTSEMKSVAPEKNTNINYKPEFLSNVLKKHSKDIITPFENSVNHSILDRSAAALISPVIPSIITQNTIPDKKKSVTIIEENPVNNEKHEHSPPKKNSLKKVLKQFVKKSIDVKKENDCIIKFTNKKKEKRLENDAVSRKTRVNQIRAKSAVHEKDFQDVIVKRFANIKFKDLNNQQLNNSYESDKEKKLDQYGSFNNHRSNLTKKMEELNRELVKDKIVQRNYKFNHYQKDYEKQEAWQMYSTLLFSDIKDEYMYIDEDKKKNKNKK